MALPVANKQFYTYEEYLDLEDADEEVRYEYHHGEVFAMSGTTKVHNRIVRNLANLLDDHFLPRGCEVWHEQIKVEAKAKERYYYPDLVVSCSERDRDSTLMVQDPVLIIEVLSEGSQRIDIYAKQTYYTRIPSLQVYIVVSQKEYVLHVYERYANGWSYQVVVGKDQQVHLEYFNLTVPVAGIYKHVRLDEITGGRNKDAGAVAP